MKATIIGNKLCYTVKVIMLYTGSQMIYKLSLCNHEKWHSFYCFVRRYHYFISHLCCTFATVFILHQRKWQCSIIFYQIYTEILQSIYPSDSYSTPNNEIEHQFAEGELSRLRWTVQLMYRSTFNKIFNKNGV